jgi:pimeloyl-ACP methyl ester carboxylesterase
MNKLFAPTILTLAVALAACNTTPSTPTETPAPTAGVTAPDVGDIEALEVQRDGLKLPRFEEASSCPFRLPENLNASNTRCGYVIVRESRRPRNDKTIKVAVLVVKSVSGKPSETANVYLQGGPGGDVQGIILGLQPQGGVLNTFAGENDLIIFDQRGVGKSQPRLECPTNNTQALAAIQRASRRPKTDPVQEEILNQLVANAVRCRDALKTQGINLQAYNTFENAADVNDIRKALGYKNLNLWGGSYGSYLAQIVMRDYRRAVRSVDLEAVIDPRQNWVALAPLAFDRSRIEIFKACANDPQCNAAFPNISSVFDALIVKLNTEQPTINVPVSETESIPVQINGDLFFNVLNQLLYSPSFLPLVPIYVSVTSAGNYAPFASILSQLFLGGDGTNSDGMYQSVVCSDVAQFTSEGEMRRLLESVTPAYRRTLGLFSLSQSRICKEWGVRPDIFATFPVISDIPTLLQVGFFDPITPPQYARGVERSLLSDQTANYPAGSHGATFASSEPGDQGECAQGILTRFWQNPRANLDVRCASSPISFFIPSGLRVQSADPFPIPPVQPAPMLPRY